MSNQILVHTGNGEVVYVEIDTTTPSAQALRGPAEGDPTLRPKGVAQGSAADRVLQETVFSKAVGVIRGLVEDVGHGLMTAEPRPAQVELELSMGLGASGNVIIFKGDANATFKLKLTWTAPSVQPPARGS